MDAETTGILISSGAVGALCGVASTWIKAKFGQKTTVENDPLNVKKLPGYVTIGECNRRMCEQGDELRRLRDEVTGGQKEILSKLDELDQRSENRAIASNQRIDKVMERSAEMRGQVEATKDLFKSAFIGGKK